MEPMLKLAGEICAELKRFEHAVCLLGGSAKQWQAPEEFDYRSNLVRQVFKQQGLYYGDGMALFSICSYHEHDNWHQAATEKNKQQFVWYFHDLMLCKLALQSWSNWKPSGTRLRWSWLRRGSCPQPRLQG